MARVAQATRQGHSSVVVEGLDAVVSDLTRKADRIRPEAERVVVEHAAKMAQRMRDRVPIGEGKTLESISSDDQASRDGTSVYADAGAEWFVARFLEHGTVNMAPRPFVGPAADDTIPGFERDLRRLT